MPDKQFYQHQTEQWWRDHLTPEQYRVLREGQTETPYSGQYEYNTDAGTYVCAACKTPLFGSDTKFDANCGWPSFYDAKPGAVELRPDNSLGMQRTEVMCATCGSHLGHIFEHEGFATPTDKRYCINSLSLSFAPQTNKV